jgi:hypothetical protein
MLARRWPDLVKSSGGGCNAVLSRSGIADHRAIRLRTWPERRVAQLVRLVEGTCVANFHGSTHVPLAEAELRRLWSEALAFADGAPLVLGGDLNLRSPPTPPVRGGEIVHVGARDVDHLFALRLVPAADGQTLDRRLKACGREVELSDHPPLIVTLYASH